MAQRRMFNLQVIDSDAFIGMPATTQNLYFHLCMRADDDGFISGPKKIQRMIGASDDDMQILLAKRFLLAFDSGVVVVKHWRLHNYIQKDRYHETLYKEEKATLFAKPNGVYTDHPMLEETVETKALPGDVSNMDTDCIQDVHKTCPQVRLGKSKSNNISPTNVGDCPEPMVQDAPTGQKKNPRKKPKPLPHDNNAYKSAKWLAKKIKKRMPERKDYTEDDLQRWARDIDKLHRIDGYEWQLISDMLVFSQEDKFWQTNILSGDALRRSFDKLMAQESRSYDD